MDERKGKHLAIGISSSSSSEDEDDDATDDEEDDDDRDHDDEVEYSDREEASESRDSDIDDESLSNKVIALLQGGGRNDSIDSLKLNECKAYLRKHGLRLAGNRAVCIARIKEHWRLKHRSGYTLYPRSSFTINCTGDVCMGDVVLFRQKVYEKFNKVTRHGRSKGSRTVAGRVVKESYGAAKQQHTFTVEVLWSYGVRKLPLLYPLLVKGRNLYKMKTYRQRWKNEADRFKVLSEKHRRGAAARSMRASNQRKKSCYADGSKDSKGLPEIQNIKRSKKGRSSEPNKLRHLDGSRRASDYQHQEVTSTAQPNWKESASSRAFGSARERHKSAEFDHYQAPVYANNRQIPFQFQGNSLSWNEPNQFFCYERGLTPKRTGLPPIRPRGGFTSRAHIYSDSHHSHANRYNFEMNNLNTEHIDRPSYLSTRDRYEWRK